MITRLSHHAIRLGIIPVLFGACGQQAELSHTHGAGEGDLSSPGHPSMQTNNLIQNGGFETLDPMTGQPTDWRLVDRNPDLIITTDDTTAFEGQRSLKFTNATDGGCWEVWPEQVLDVDALVGGCTYTIRFRYKADFNDDSGLFFVLENSAFDINWHPDVRFDNRNEWQVASFDIDVPERVGADDPRFVLDFCVSSPGNWWLDAIEMVPEDAVPPDDSEPILMNGSFESIDDFTSEPEFWGLRDGNPQVDIAVDDTLAFDGTYSLRFSNENDSGCWEVFIDQQVDRHRLVGGERYTMSFRHRADFNGTPELLFFLRNRVIDISVFPRFAVSDRDEWNLFSFDFELPDNIGGTDPTLTLDFCPSTIGQWWIDAVELAPATP